MERKRSDAEAINAIRFVMSGTEWDADTLDTIADLIRSTGRDIASPDDIGRVRQVVFAGYKGDRLQPPEPAESIIWCPRCHAYTDAVGNDNPLECMGIGFGRHEVEVDLSTYA